MKTADEYYAQRQQLCILAEIALDALKELQENDPDATMKRVQILDTYMKLIQIVEKRLERARCDEWNS